MRKADRRGSAVCRFLWRPSESNAADAAFFPHERKLYFKLNNRLERDVDMIQAAPETMLNRHFGLVARLRILISNREAVGYLCVGAAMAVLFGFTFVWITVNGYGSAGHIYSLTTYLWMFATGLDDMPRPVESYSNLKDIARRVEVTGAQSE